MSSFYGTVKHGDEISPGWMQNVEDALGSGTPAKKASYHIWTTNNSTWYARHGRTGVRESDDDLANLINEKILELYDAQSGPGGLITLGPYAGKQSLNSSINMRPGVYLQGESRGTNLRTYVTALYATSDFPMVKFDPPTDIPLADYAYYGGLSSLRLDGDGNVTSYPLIDINPSTNRGWGDITLNDLVVQQGKYGLRINNNTTSSLIWNVHVILSYFEDATYNGILVDSPTDQEIKQCRFIGNHFYNNCTSGGNGAFEIDGHNTRGGILIGNTWELEKRCALYMADEADGWSIGGGNVIIDAGQLTDNTYAGISLNDVDFINITGTVSMTRANTKMKYGYISDNNCTYLCTIGNVFVGQTAGAVQGTGTGNVPANANMGSYNVVKTA